MAQLNDLIVTGASRFLNTIQGTAASASALTTPVGGATSPVYIGSAGTPVAVNVAGITVNNATNANKTTGILTLQTAGVTKATFNGNTTSFNVTTTDLGIGTAGLKSSSDFKPASNKYAGSTVDGGMASVAHSTEKSLTLQLNGGTSTAWNGSAAVTFNVTPSAIGASATGHSHTTADITSFDAAVKATKVNNAGTADLGKRRIFIQGNQTAPTTGGAWTGDASEYFQSSADLVDGQEITYWVPLPTTGNVTLNLKFGDGTSSGAVACYYGNTSRLTTHYGQGQAVHLTYRKNVKIPSTGTSTYTGWWADANYDSNSNTIDVLQGTYTIPVAGATAGLKQYSLFAQDANGKYSSFTTQNGTAVNKTVNRTDYFDISKIYYCSTSGNYATNANIGTSVFRWAQALVDLRYTLNISTSALTARKPLYLIFDMQSTALGTEGQTCYKLAGSGTTDWWTQTIPSEAEVSTKIFVKVSEAVYDGYRADLSVKQNYYDAWNRIGFDSHKAMYAFNAINATKVNGTAFGSLATVSTITSGMLPTHTHTTANITNFTSAVQNIKVNNAGTADYASNAAKVNNLTVQTAVPANAKFTDTAVAQTVTTAATKTFIVGNAGSATTTSGLNLSTAIGFTSSPNAEALEFTCGGGKIFSFKKTDEAQNIDIGWDWSLGHGAGLALRSKDRSANPGEFAIFARKDTSTACQLMGRTDGTLRWNSRRVVTANDGSAVGGVTTPVYVDANGYTSACTPLTMMVGTASYVKAPNSSGYYTDQYGNFKHQSSGVDGYLAWYGNSGATAAQLYWETGTLRTKGDLEVGGKITSGMYEAYLSWGGKNFVSDFGPLDAAMVGNLGANRLAFFPGSAVTIEYTRDGGTTWTDYEATNDNKATLFARGDYGFYIGKADSTNKATEHGTDYQLRVTINTGAGNLYTILNKFLLYISTNGSNECTCKIQKALESTPATFVDVTDDVTIGGWSGYNIINTGGITTYGNTAASQYGRIRFLFKANGGNTNNIGLRILLIQAFGGVGWTTPSNMAKMGHIYNYDQDQNAMFPAGIQGSNYLNIGYQNTASGAYSQALGYQTRTASTAAHAEGYYTVASALYAHAEGGYTTASGIYSHAEGYYCLASGDAAHAGGSWSTASKAASYANGLYLNANVNYQTVIGKYNSTISNALFIVGNGTATNARSNAMYVTTAGKIKASSFDASIEGATDVRLDGDGLQVDQLHIDSGGGHIYYKDNETNYEFFNEYNTISGKTANIAVPASGTAVSAAFTVPYSRVGNTKPVVIVTPNQANCFGYIAELTSNDTTQLHTIKIGVKNTGAAATVVFHYLIIPYNA